MSFSMESLLLITCSSAAPPTISRANYAMSIWMFDESILTGLYAVFADVPGSKFFARSRRSAKPHTTCLRLYIRPNGGGDAPFTETASLRVRQSRAQRDQIGQIVAERLLRLAPTMAGLYPPPYVLR